MGVVEQLTRPEGSGETVSSTEIGGQSILWKEHAPDHGQPALAEIPDEEAAGSPPLEDEQEKIEEDDTSRIGPEETLRTKNPAGPN